MSIWNVFKKKEKPTSIATAQATEADTSTNEKLNYLRKYNKKIEIVSASDCLSHIPKEWQSILAQADSATRVTQTITLWENIVGSELRNTIAYLKENLMELDLLYNGSVCTMLYSLRSTAGSEPLYYEAGFAGDVGVLPPLKEAWDAVPPSVRKFYDSLHDGFYYYASHSMGLSPFYEIAHLAEYDWSILESIKEPLQINLDTTFGFFTNGMGAYVAIDTDSTDKDIATIWFKNKPPRYGVNFWDVVDEWIVMGFRG